MKAFSDLEQSKKLAKILPIESADMKWFFWKDEIDAPKTPTFGYSKTAAESYKDTEAVYLACWSLAALLGVLPVMIDYKGSIIRLRMDKGNVGQDEYAIWYDDLDNGLSTDIASESKNFIDAAYKMILKLHELNLL